MGPPAPHTPIVFLQGGGSAFFSQRCQEALLAAQLNPDWFGSYKHVAHLTGNARDRVDGWAAMTPAEQAANPAAAPTSEETFLAQCTSSHLIQDGVYRTGPPRGDPCVSINGYTEGQAPCVAGEGSGAVEGSVEWWLTYDENSQRAAQRARNAADGRPADDYPAAQRTADEDARTDTLTAAHRDRYPQATGNLPRGTGPGGSFAGPAEAAAAAADVGARPPAAPTVADPLVVDGETAEECINAWRKRAAQAMRREGLDQEIATTRAAGHNRPALEQRERDAKDAQTQASARVDAAEARGAPPDEVERLSAHERVARREADRATADANRARTADRQLGCLERMRDARGRGAGRAFQ